jgi:hypothetical protein
LSTLWPYRSESELAGAIQDAFRLPDNIHLVTATRTSRNYLLNGISAIPHQNLVLTRSIAASI